MGDCGYILNKKVVYRKWDVAVVKNGMKWISSNRHVETDVVCGGSLKGENMSLFCGGRNRMYGEFITCPHFQISFLDILHLIFGRSF